MNRFLRRLLSGLMSETEFKYENNVIATTPGLWCGHENDRVIVNSEPYRVILYLDRVGDTITRTVLLKSDSID